MSPTQASELAGALNDLREIVEVVEGRRNHRLNGSMPSPAEVDELTDAANRVLRMARPLVAKPLPNARAE
jgi:hypothetical protein